MSARAAIRGALRARYELDDLIPALRQWEGTRLDPKPSDTYVRETCLFGGSEAEYEGGQVETVGVYQLDIIGPVKVGAADNLPTLDAIAESAAAAFPIHSRLTGAGGIAVEIASVATGPTLPLDAGRLQIPVSIAWRAYHLNPTPVLT